MSKKTILLILLLPFIFIQCFSKKESEKESINGKYDLNLPGAGFRYSVYGARNTPDTKEYWQSVADRMAGLFPGTQPECIWIVGTLKEQGCFLNFPANTDHPLIFSSEQDYYEEFLNFFDQKGMRVWLQIEPGMAPVEELLHLVLNQYSHHASVVGIGIDVEWHKSTVGSEGEPVTDEDALAWLKIAHEYNPDYQLLLKHWLVEVMPPSVRENVYFISNSQMLPSLQFMVEEFSRWGQAFAPSKVGFQIGYRSDKNWWSNFNNPAKTIGEALLNNIPNLGGLYWVDFTAIEAFPETRNRPENLILMKNKWSVAVDPFGSEFHYEEPLITNDIAEVSFTIAKRTHNDQWSPYIELICDVEADFSGFSGVRITYQCGTDLLMKLSQHDFGSIGNKTYSHYQYRLPPSCTWNTVWIDFSLFEQPYWTPEISKSIPLIKENINAVYMVPDLDATIGETTTIRVNHLELY